MGRRSDEVGLYRIDIGCRPNLETPLFGPWPPTRRLRRPGYTVGRPRARRLMRLLGLRTVFQRSKTPKSYPEHEIYPYLLRDQAIIRPDQARCADVN